MNTRIPSIILSVIILASILLPLTYLTTPAQAAGTVATIETSTPNGKFNYKKVVEIRIFDPDVEDWNATQPY
ncbi:MAG TPA: hypothetical protein ENG44_03860, partial [Desulfurococcaceae archaeon]|nr:hypothetical protein [Desulfurococcaceae archaeon]